MTPFTQQQNPLSEAARHALRCPGCGQLFDLRDPLAVLLHQHREGQLPERQRSLSERAPARQPHN